MPEYRVKEFTRGELASKHGIVSARLTTLADALNTTPTGVLRTVETADVDPMVDTATDKGRSRAAEERPSDPDVRCLAFAVEDFRQLAAVVGAEEALEGDAVPA